MTIYVVRGQSGEDPPDTWLVGAYPDEQAAMDHAARAQGRADAIKMARWPMNPRVLMRDYYGVFDANDTRARNEHDAAMVMNYGGVHYDVLSCELSS